MKKMFFFAALVIVAACTCTSCKKTCTCTESGTGVTQDIGTDSQYKNCQDIEDLFKSTAAGTGQHWSCK